LSDGVLHVLITKEQVSF